MIIPSVYFQFLVKFMKYWYLIEFSVTLLKIICSLKVSLASCQPIYVFLNYYWQKASNRGLFSKKQNQGSTLRLEFDNNILETVEIHKQLGLSLDQKLDFNTLIDKK